MPPSSHSNAERQRRGTTKSPACRLSALTLFATLTLTSAVPNAVAAGLDAREWATAPYRVRAMLAVDDGRRPQPGLESAVARHIAQRVDATLTPLWSFELAPAADPATRSFCLDPTAAPSFWDKDQPPDELDPYDKLLWLGVEVTPIGYELRCREFDALTRRWGPPHERAVQQAAFVAEACYQLLKDSFSALALIEPVEGDDKQVRLAFKGWALPQRGDGDLFVSPGAALQPLIRRTDRSGRLVENGVQPVPWTLLSAAEPKDGAWMAVVHSGMRRPFGARRGALMQQLAIALNYAPGPTRVRFHGRTDVAEGLAGYEVFRAQDDGASELIGVTDRDGAITIPPGDGNITTVLLRSDGQMLAKLPVATGAAETLEAPIADNASRLRAQAEARVVREELIDVVARRAILMARVRAMLKEGGRQADAVKIMAELDALPTNSAFGRTIDNASRRIPDSGDARVQQVIDNLFSTTREMLAKFLNPRAISELQSEVNAASASGS